MRFASTAAADRATAILRHGDHARCVGRSVAADLGAAPTETELLDVSVVPLDSGNRVTFTGGDRRGMLSVHLDVVVLRAGPAVAVLWFGDGPDPFDDAERAHVVERLRARAQAAGGRP